jgi:putative sigma-54 modulation protein
MIDKLEISGIHTDTTEDINKYVYKKIAKLDAFMPKHARKSAHAEVRLIESKNKGRRQFTAEVTLYLPGEVINAKETTVNIYAAIDIVEEKLKAQIRRYKIQNSAKRGANKAKVRSLFGKIIRKKS